MLQTFHEMWTELLEELVYVLDYPTTESVHSLDHWNLVVCEDVPARCDPQRTLELVRLCQTVKELLTKETAIMFMTL